MFAQKLSKYLSFAILASLIVPLTVATLSGCSAASSANAKKQKSKKAISKPDSSDEEEEAETAASDPKGEPAENKKNANVVEKNDKTTAAFPKSKEKPAAENKEKINPEKPKAVSPEAIWADLIKGNQRFREGRRSNNQFIAARHKSVEGRHSQVIVLGCADSSVPPELIFDKNPGDLFVVRAAGNIADSVELGSIEYAVEHLNATMLVILGHEECGAVAAALSGEEMPSENLEAIVEKIVPSFEGSKTCPLKSQMNLSCIELNVRQSAKDVLLNSRIIKEAMAQKRLTLIQAVYHLESGEVVRLS